MMLHDAFNFAEKYYQLLNILKVLCCVIEIRVYCFSFRILNIRFACIFSRRERGRNGKKWVNERVIVVVVLAANIEVSFPKDT